MKMINKDSLMDAEGGATPKKDEPLPSENESEQSSIRSSGVELEDTDPDFQLNENRGGKLGMSDLELNSS